jgi:hypothetical protein
LAATARQAKKIEKIKDTWTSDGVIFLKLGIDTVRRITKQNELDELL